MKLRSRITEIVEEVFQHGKLTPNKSYNLPKGQITIADGINQLETLFKQTMGEVRREVNEEEEIDFKKEKYCPNCRKIKLKSQFRSNVARHDGVTQYCKACMRIKSKTNYELYYKSVKNKL